MIELVDRISHQLAAYFSELEIESVEFEPHYEVFDAPETYDFTGIVGITGFTKGCIYASGTTDFVREMARIQLGNDEDTLSDDDLLDMIGELTNVFGGYACELLGKDTSLSVPVVIAGATTIRPPMPLPTFAFPVRWRQARLLVVVGLQTP